MIDSKLAMLIRCAGEVPVHRGDVLAVEGGQVGVGDEQRSGPRLLLEQIGNVRLEVRRPPVQAQMDAVDLIKRFFQPLGLEELAELEQLVLEKGPRLRAERPGVGPGALLQNQAHGH